MDLEPRMLSPILLLLVVWVVQGVVSRDQNQQDQRLNSSPSLLSLLRKRAVDATWPLAGQSSFVQNKHRKRSNLAHSLGVADEDGRAFKQERKRDCDINMGFHCDTERAWDMAELYDFLNDAKSPGKK